MTSFIDIPEGKALIAIAKGEDSSCEGCCFAAGCSMPCMSTEDDDYRIFQLVDYPGEANDVRA